MTSSRYLSLDVLRGIAILGTLGTLHPRPGRVAVEQQLSSAGEV